MGLSKILASNERALEVAERMREDPVYRELMVRKMTESEPNPNYVSPSRLNGRALEIAELLREHRVELTIDYLATH
jgi:hypothetical protein